MVVLDRHYQSKKDKKRDTSTDVEIIMYSDDTCISITQEVNSEYLRFGQKKRLSVFYNVTINLKNGNIVVHRNLTNHTFEFNEDKSNRRGGTNNFSQIETFTEDGFKRGEKRLRYWGIKYERATDRMYEKMYKILSPYLITDYYKNKDYLNKYVVSPLFDLFVDFHLSKKKIKGHDNVYHTIQYEYPSPKYLKANDYKFLPALLDGYGIKTKYIIGELNKLTSGEYSVRALSYICHLFGDNHIDYIKKIVNWQRILYDGIPNKKYHYLKNETEKNNMIKLINHWEENGLMDNSLIFSINDLLSTRQYLEDKGYKLKFTAKDDDTFEQLQTEWMSLRIHNKKGYRIRYSFPTNFLQDVETDITTQDGEFKVTVLKTEDEFTLEGHIMKNCMGNQFKTGSLYVYLIMKHKNKRINLQYRKGYLNQHYGKANSTVDKVFLGAISELSKKMSRHCEVSWKKEKFDFIS